METYYTDKEKHIHTFLLGKGWTKEEIHKAMLTLTQWTTVTEMSIEAYYEVIMGKRAYRKFIFGVIITLAFITLLIFTLIKGG